MIVHRHVAHAASMADSPALTQPHMLCVLEAQLQAQQWERVQLDRIVISLYLHHHSAAIIRR